MTRRNGHIALRRRRDGQQWILDWLVKTTGRGQNFANDERTVPEDVKSYRMIPRVLYKVAKHQEDLVHEAGSPPDTTRSCWSAKSPGSGRMGRTSGR